MKTAIWWVRRDLRLFDNQALRGALAHADQVIPLFIVDPSLWQSRYAGDKRKSYLRDALVGLDASLRQRGSQLIIRHGIPLHVLTALCHQHPVDHIYAEADYSPYARERDASIANVLPLTLTGGVSIFPPDAVRKANGEPYTVFTPYSRTWKTLPLPDEATLPKAPERIPSPVDMVSQALPEATAPYPRDIFTANEENAQARLHTFIDGRITGYAEQRDILDVYGTSRLSPCFRFGLLSSRYAAALAQQARQHKGLQAGADTWLNELIWRDFYISILYHFPYVRKMSFRESLRNITWSNDTDAFITWQKGRTGYPVVDAAMRQLLAWGWMHNRARMITASFLVKHLLIDWRWGEQHFMQHLIDGDPAANNGGWQWSAGTGTDASPYFRIFNPILQSKKYDADGTYIRRWVPELNNVPTKYIHTPWLMPEDIQRTCKVIIGETYPHPIVDHKWARQRALDTFKAAKNATTA